VLTDAATCAYRCCSAAAAAVVGPQKLPAEHNEKALSLASSDLDLRCHIAMMIPGNMHTRCIYREHATTTKRNQCLDGRLIGQPQQLDNLMLGGAFGN
jgi:hypothetical protein